MSERLTTEHPSKPVTLKDTGYPPQVLYSTVINNGQKPPGQHGPKKSKGSERKIGRMKRKDGWANNGGERRMLARKARNHGCGRPDLHRKPVESSHSGDMAA